MKRAWWGPLSAAALGMGLALGASFAASADNCSFAYGFCMPRYNACVSSGVPQYECHAELDACLLRNGCSTLP